MIKNMLRSVPDPRKSRGRSYELWSILALILVGFLCGRQGLMSVFRMGRGLSKEQRRKLGFWYKMPCHATLTETLRDVDADALAEVLGRIVLIESNGKTRQIAIDGKTMRGSEDEQGRAMHCVSAFCHGLQQVINHTASRGKGLEIPDALALLDRLDLKDKIVTADALLCQQSIVKKIVDKGGDYVLPVKDNQKTLKEAIHTAFEMPVFPPHELDGTSTKGARTDRTASHRRAARRGSRRP
jgi:predicted transposase YbfD/YdcC